MQEREMTYVYITTTQPDPDDSEIPVVSVPMTIRESDKLIAKIEAFAAMVRGRRDKEARRREAKAAKLEQEAKTLRGES